MQQIDPPTIEHENTRWQDFRKYLRDRSTQWEERFHNSLRKFKLVCIACFLLEGFAAGFTMLQLGTWMKLPESYGQISSLPMRIWVLAVAAATITGGLWLSYDLIHWWFNKWDEERDF